MEEEKVSSSWTKPMLLLMFFLWIVLPFWFLSTTTNFKLSGGQIFAILFFVVLVGLTLYLTFSLCEVKVVGNEIRFKKIFGQENVYSFDKIGYPSSFRFKRLKFTSIEMKNQSGNVDKYLILNNDALLSGERIDAEQILLSLRQLNRS